MARRKTARKTKRRVSMATRRKISRALRSKRQAGKKHRLTVYKSKSGRVTRSRRSRVVGRKTRINPRRRSYRRNPVRVQQLVNKKLVTNAVTFLVGFGGGLYAKNQLAKLPILAGMDQRFIGAIPMLAGGFLATTARRKELRAVAGGVFAAGLFDLVAQFINLPLTASVNGTNFIPGGPAEVVNGLGAAINSNVPPMVVDASGYQGDASFVDSIDDF